MFMSAAHDDAALQHVIDAAGESLKLVL
jgi:hypothetical protein